MLNVFVKWHNKYSTPLWGLFVWFSVEQD